MKLITPDKNIVTLNPPQPKVGIKIGVTSNEVCIVFSEPVMGIPLSVRGALDMASLLIKHAGTLAREPETQPGPIIKAGDGNGT